MPDVAQFVWTGTDVIVQLENDDGLVTALKQADITGSLNFSLQAMADVSGEVIPIPYDPSGQSAPGWFFCDAGYNRLTPAAGTKGTQYVRIAHAPVGFDTLFWQNVAVDYGSVQKERVHKGWKSQFPSLAAVRRIYRDYPDFPDQDIEPVQVQVTFTYSITPDGPLKGLEGVEVVATDQSQPVPGLNVTAVQGWKGSLTEPVWFGSTTTDDSGLAIVLLKSPRSDPVRIVVSTPARSSGPLYIPVIRPAD